MTAWLARPVIAVAAAALLLTATTVPAEAGHDLRCGAKESIGAVGVQACTRRVDGVRQDQVFLSVRLWNSADGARTVRYNAEVFQFEDGGYELLAGFVIRERVPANSTRRVTYLRSVPFGSGQNVWNTARVTYSAADGRWSDWSGLLSRG